MKMSSLFPLFNSPLVGAYTCRTREIVFLGVPRFPKLHEIYEVFRSIPKTIRHANVLGESIVIYSFYMEFSFLALVGYFRVTPVIDKFSEIGTGY